MELITPDESDHAAVKAYIDNNMPTYVKNAGNIDSDVHQIYTMEKEIAAAEADLLRVQEHETFDHLYKHSRYFTTWDSSQSDKIQKITDFIFRQRKLCAGFNYFLHTSLYNQHVFLSYIKKFRNLLDCDTNAKIELMLSIHSSSQVFSKFVAKCKETD